MQKTLKTRLLILFLTVVMCFGIMTPAHAYEVVYIQTSIDISQWEIVSGVIRTNVGVTQHSPEFRRVEESALNDLMDAGNSVGEFNALIKNLDDEGYLDGSKEIANGVAQAGVLTNLGWFEEENRVLTFPTNQSRRDNSTPEDYEEATKINNELVFGLNQAFNAYIEKKGYTKTDNAQAFMNKMLEFLAQCGSDDSLFEISNDECRFPYNGKTVSVKWKMDKSDGTCISWGSIVYEAFNNYCLEGEEGVNASNVYSDMNTTALSKAITSFFAWCLDSLYSALGLWSMDELIFSQGIRQYAYLGGIFPTAWEKTLWTLFTVFEIFGAAMLMAGVIVSVVHKALSTTNVIERMHLMEKIQTLIVCAVILAILPFALRIMISLSSSLTQMAYSMFQIPEKKPKEVNDLVKRFAASNGSIGGLVGQFMYFGIRIYFNFYYAVRAFSVPVLIIMSPLFVCGICLSSSRKQLAMQWSKELISFIFMQPIHAFCMALVLILPISSRGLDNIIILYAIIPLSQTLKTLLFGQTSGFAERTADQAKGTSTKLLAAAGIGAVTAGVKGGAAVLGGLISGGSGGGSDGNSSNNSSGSDPSGGSDPGASSPGGGGFSMGKAVSAVSSAAKKAAGKVKDISSQAGHAITNSRVGQAIKNNPGFFNAVGGKELAIGAAKTFALKPAQTALKVAKTGAKASKTGARIAGGMALGAAGGMIGALGGGDLGRTMSNGGATIVAGRKLNKDESSSNQDPSSNSSNDPNLPNPPQPNAEDTFEPIGLNTGGTRDADDVVNGTVMEPRNFNQSDLDKKGISNVSYERGSLRFASGGDSPQAQELRAYAQFLDTLPPEQKQEEIERRGISATQDGDLTRVRIDTKTWSRANGGATIDGYTNKKGDSSISVSSPKNGAPPSFTGGELMNVNPTQIRGYQQTTRTVANEDGTTRQEAVGSVPIQNTTAMQQAILSSGQGVTRDDNNFYVPLNQNGQPQKYVQKVSFAAREKHMKQLKEMTARPQPQGPQPEGNQPQGSPDSSQQPLPNGSVQTEPPRSPSANPRTQPVEVEPPKRERQIDTSQPPQVENHIDQSRPPEVETQINQTQQPEPEPQSIQPQSQEPVPQTEQFQPADPPVEYDDPSQFSTYIPTADDFSFAENEGLEPNNDEFDLSQLVDEMDWDFS